MAALQLHTIYFNKFVQLLIYYTYIIIVKHFKKKKQQI